MCVHIQAAAQAIGFTHSMRKQAAAHLVEHGEIQYDSTVAACWCTSLADVLKPVLCRPLDGSCTCLDYSLHGTCCHLLAAEQLPDLAGLSVATGSLLLDDSDDEQVGGGRCMEIMGVRKLE